MIVMCFDHLSEAHIHMSSFAANMSSLAKICNPETFDMVMKAAARLMIQINIPGHYLCKRRRQFLVMSTKSISQFLNLVPQEILVMAPKLQEEEGY